MNFWEKCNSSNYRLKEQKARGATGQFQLEGSLFENCMKNFFMIKGAKKKIFGGSS